jgi:hypothetical protein
VLFGRIYLLNITRYFSGFLSWITFNLHITNLDRTIFTRYGD